MARLTRVVVPDHPHHVTQRGNRRQQTFFCDADYELCKSLLASYCAREGVEIWAYCLMPNHVHLIASPRNGSPCEYRTVIHIGCENANGLTEEKPIVDAIWSEFSDRSVTHWDGGNAMRFQRTTKALKPDELLRADDGKCGAWARFYRDCLLVQGIHAEKLRVVPAAAQILPPGATGWKRAGLFVKNWTFVYDLLAGLTPTRGAPLPAQGGPDPLGKYVEHALVVYNSGGAPRLYDPSYGLDPILAEDEAQGLQLWQIAALDAVAWDLTWTNLSSSTAVASRDWFNQYCFLEDDPSGRE